MKRNDDPAPGDAQQVACQGVTLPWLSTVGERAGGTCIRAVHNIHSLVYCSGQIRCLLTGVQLCPCILLEIAQLLMTLLFNYFTHALSVGTLGNPQEEMNYLLFLKWFSLERSDLIVPGAPHENRC